jgi:predicted AAA+ superfamily ATPase
MFFYYGTTDRKEIAFILEFGEKVVAIEVKASRSVSKDMFKHIYSLQKEIPNHFSKGIVFYGGDDFLKLDENMYAIPLGFLG